MNLSEHQFEDLSDLEYRIFTAKLGSEYTPTALVLQFSGTYGHGTLGNGDAAFMRAVTLAALSAWDAGAVIFDLRELDYEWGDEIWNVFGSGSIPPFTVEHPQALVVSERCRPGFSTCAGMVPKMFDDLESAIAFVRQEELDRRRREKRELEKAVASESLGRRPRRLFFGR